MEWTADGLRLAGFEGFVPFAALPTAGAPETPGVYVVLWSGAGVPAFLESSAAGWFKGKDPTVDRERLERKWLTATVVVYAGTATGGIDGKRTLHRRLDEYRRHGAGEPIGHWGGRYVWQLTDSNELLVCWRVTSGAEAEATETALLDDFKAQFGALPFANLKRGRRTRIS